MSVHSQVRHAQDDGGTVQDMQRTLLNTFNLTTYRRIKIKHRNRRTYFTSRLILLGILTTSENDELVKRLEVQNERRNWYVNWSITFVDG